MIEVARRYKELVAQRDGLLEALQSLVFAADCRDNTMGGPCRLIEVRAGLASAANRAREVIAKARGQ